MKKDTGKKRQCQGHQNGHEHLDKKEHFVKVKTPRGTMMVLTTAAALCVLALIAKENGWEFIPEAFAHWKEKFYTTNDSGCVGSCFGCVCVDAGCVGGCVGCVI